MTWVVVGLMQRAVVADRRHRLMAGWRDRTTLASVRARRRRMGRITAQAGGRAKFPAVSP